MSRESYSIGDFDGNAQLSFYVQEGKDFKPNQTLCHAEMQNRWSSDECLTEVDTERRLLNCTCNLMSSQMIAIMDDKSK